MNKKKYIYPLVFSVGFVVLQVALVTICNAAFSAEEYGGLILDLLFLAFWFVILLPIYSIYYCRLIINEKFNFLLALYNLLVIIILCILPFNLRGETTILVFFILWVLFWNFVPLTGSLIYRKSKDKYDSDNS
ncbi:MAG: hypothetical protein IJN17_01585 [Clostridia bacterium]|nr:hypothetical protein [Clostridia bacterium]